MKTKKTEFTKKELNKLIGDAREEGYEMGKRHCMYPRNLEKSLAVSKLIDALEEVFDKRYEPLREDY